MSRFAYLLLLPPILCIACKSRPKEDPAQAAAIRGFYNAVLNIKTGGIPGGQDLKRIQPFLSNRLYKLISAGLDAEGLYGEKTKYQTPPLVEGSFFFSLFEGADRIISYTPEQIQGVHSYLMECEYGTGESGSKPTRWKERAILTNENNKWVVDDIEHLGDWDFASKGKLSDTLHSVINTAKETKPD